MHEYNIDPRFSIQLSESWHELEDDDKEVYSFSKKDNGVGALQVSLAKKEVERVPDQSECARLLQDYFSKQNAAPTINTSVVGFGCVSHAETVTEDKRFLAAWIFMDNQRIAFLTYNGPQDLYQSEYAEVREMVNSFTLKS